MPTFSPPGAEIEVVATKVVTEGAPSFRLPDQSFWIRN